MECCFRGGRVAVFSGRRLLLHRQSERNPVGTVVGVGALRVQQDAPSR